ncbi:hypothetical protein ACH5RR_030504 [Cinchona calisaya]|uniref:Uncharacterized protein n=1 Tax=Cinchona calisaya TaxID=153742 RepID=A0ABD2YVZ2_9GENT
MLEYVLLLLMEIGNGQLEEDCGEVRKLIQDTPSTFMPCSSRNDQLKWFGFRQGNMRNPWSAYSLSAQPPLKYGGKSKVFVWCIEEELHGVWN